jgi:glycosyltransferase involved in cell wall biosynthesis
MSDCAEVSLPVPEEILVSVLLPVRNGAADVLSAVRCVLGQTWVRLELIVIDDHSEDDTSALLETIEDPRLRVVAAPERGLVGALRHGASIARGGLIARMDVDDDCDIDRIARQAAFMASHPAVAVVGSSFEVIDADGRHVRFEPALSHDSDLRRELFVRNPLGHGTTMIRASALSAVGGYRSTFPHAEDYDLWIRLAEVGELAALPEPLYRWRRHDGSTSSQHRPAQIASSKTIREDYWRVLPVAIGVQELRDQIHSYRAETACCGELAGRFLQVQLAVAFEAARRGHLHLAMSQVGAVVWSGPWGLAAVFWFAATGGRHISRHSATGRLRGRHM